MSLVFRLEEPPEVSGDIGNDDIRFGSLALTQAAKIGEAPISTITFDDPTGALNVVGYRLFSVRETAAPTNDQLLWRGRVGRRTYRRGTSNLTAAARNIETELADQNVLFGWRLMMDANAKRPAETAGDRIRWLVSTLRIPIYAHPTYFANPSTPMDPNDYRGQRYGDVLADIANVTGYNYWCEYVEARDRAELFFIDPGGTDYASALLISNDLADIDSTTIFASSKDATLVRDPSRITASAYVPYENGFVYKTRDSTGNQFAYVDQAAPTATIKSAAKASALADRYLDDNDEEDDKITCSVFVAPAQVNAIRAGHLIYVKFTHFPGYEDFTGMRVLQRTVIQSEEQGQQGYQITLELSPAGPATPIEGESVEMEACNTVVENAGRAGFADSSGSGLASGQVWSYEITNTGHSPFAVTDSYELNAGSQNVFSYSRLLEDPFIQGAAAPFTVCPPFTGSFAVGTIAPGSEFHFEGTADYGGGTPLVNECWTIVLERIS